MQKLRSMFADVRVVLVRAAVFVTMCYLVAFAITIGAGSKEQTMWMLLATASAIGAGLAVHVYHTAGTTKAQAIAGSRRVEVVLTSPEGMPDDTISELAEFGLYILRSGRIPDWRKAIMAAGDVSHTTPAAVPPAVSAASSAATRPATPEAAQAVTPVTPKTDQTDDDEEQDFADKAKDLGLCGWCREKPGVVLMDAGTGCVQPVCQTCADKRAGKVEDTAKKLEHVG